MGLRLALIFIALLSAPCQGAAAPRATVSLAAAANLTFAIQALNAEFARSEPNVTVTTTLGSSGNLFAQITNGAPFDVFLSADNAYPARLVRDGNGIRATLRVFATGKLVLWTTRSDVRLADLAAAVRSQAVRKIAIAQPTTAPYGRAAEQVLHSLGVWDDAKRKLVVGENIAQTAQFVETGNADVGFVALSLVKASRLAHQGRWAEIPPTLYATVSLEHAGVLTARGGGNPAARKYLEFLASPAAKRILEEQGYAVPPPRNAER